MVSVGILGMIMTLVWSTTAQSLRAKDRIEARDEVFHAAQVGLRKISDDVAEAFLVKAAPAPAAAAGGMSAAPQAAATESFKTFFIGEDKADQDSVRFSSLSHLRLVKDSKQSDQCKISYEAVPNPENPRGFDVIRREDLWLDATTEVKSKGYPLLENLVQFNIEYYDERKNEWGKEWDTEKLDWAGKLPLAVRVTIAFTDPDDDTKTIPLGTTFLLPMAPGPIEM